MYKAEQISLVQHIVFGSLFSLKSAQSGTSIRRPRLSGIVPSCNLPGSALGRAEFKAPSQVSAASVQSDSFRSQKSE
ncbi:hypothetical protein NQ318_010882 [Aromia moschata]|uniref:Uncharacterized protein n=1 Tax=Aromia moschata TaxID=1265417 RepID=A0AAV8X664_9CUCU|nr:hypothetical protein NQ318_010882 [Aromia moschata]